MTPDLQAADLAIWIVLALTVGAAVLVPTMDRRRQAKARLKSRVGEIAGAMGGAGQTPGAGGAAASINQSSLRRWPAAFQRWYEALDNWFALAGGAAMLFRIVIVFGVLGGALGFAAASFLLWDDVTRFLAALTGMIAAPAAAAAAYRRRRLGKFLDQFPAAIDFVIRGAQAGIPVTGSISMISGEFDAPLGPEFKRMSDQLAIGASIGDVLAMARKRIAVTEFHMFTVSVALQRQAGGRISETMGNLSFVLRARHEQRLKIKALTSEVRASAGIVSAVPFGLAGIIFLIDPSGLFLLTETETGRSMLNFGLIMLAIGFGVMRLIMGTVKP